MVFVFCLTSLSIIIFSSSIHFAGKWHCFILSYDQVVLHYLWIYIDIYIPHQLYIFICGWTVRVLPWLDYCKQCCYDHRECLYLFKLEFSLYICPEMGFLDLTSTLFLIFLKEPPYCFPQWLHQFTFPPTV